MLLRNKRYYLDYAAATPVDNVVLRAMKPYWGICFANPSSIHQSGRLARADIDKAAQGIKQMFSLRRNDHVVWTSGGTESNHLAIDAVIDHWKQSNPGKTYTVAISAVEHPSVVDFLEAKNDPLLSVQYITVDSCGKIDLEFVDKNCAKWGNLILVSCIFQSSEVGTTQSIKDLVNVIQKKYPGADGQVRPVFHVDASQGLYYHRINIQDLGVQMITLCGQKIGGPKGVGVLLLCDTGDDYVKREGTVPVPLVIGLCKALCLAQEQVSDNTQKILFLRKLLFSELGKKGVDFRINGVADERSLIMNVSFNRDIRDSEQLVIAFDNVGLEVSSKSACMGSQAQDSRVLSAMGLHPQNSIRLCVHHKLKERDIIRIVDRICTVISKK